MKKALRETQTLRARWLYSKVRKPPARPLQTHKPTERTDYNTVVKVRGLGAQPPAPI